MLSEFVSFDWTLKIEIKNVGGMNGAQYNDAF